MDRFVSHRLASIKRNTYICSGLVQHVQQCWVILKTRGPFPKSNEKDLVCCTKVQTLGCRFLSEREKNCKSQKELSRGLCSPYLTLDDISRVSTGQASGAGFEKINGLFLTFKNWSFRNLKIIQKPKREINMENLIFSSI